MFNVPLIQLLREFVAEPFGISLYPKPVRVFGRWEALVLVTHDCQTPEITVPLCKLESVLLEARLA